MTAYERICAERCPNGCGLSVPRYLAQVSVEDGERFIHINRVICTAPSKDEVIEELVAQLAEAKRDGERLDWWETQNYNGSTQVYLGGPWTQTSTNNKSCRGVWKIEDKEPRYDLGRFKTLRGAIDAAMSREGGAGAGIGG